ncbi:MAG: hypothetical protein PHC61_10825 [Chitinivibrionales bacterium]|nr:hypothetical protein [Chitinivibrionales bacterium]
MSSSLHRYLVNAYVSHGDYDHKHIRRDFPIQIDDQDNNDILSDFCNIFVIVKKRGAFEIELTGNVPITPEIADLVDIYGGTCEGDRGRLMLPLNLVKIEVLLDLATRIRRTAQTDTADHAWYKIASRTISSLYRFVRIVKEYRRSKGSLV